MKTFTLAELQSMPTLEQGHTDDLKVIHRTHPWALASYKVWLSRLTVEDGALYDNEVTVECCYKGRWVTINSYEAK